MEDALGVHSLNKVNMMAKLPAPLFRDTSADGPLFTIGTICADYLRNKGLKRMDWQSPAFRAAHIDLCTRFRQELIRAGHIRRFKIFIRPDCATSTHDLASLQKMITKLGGEIAEKEGPGVTHVICPFGHKGDPDDGQQYLRTLELKASKAFVHWWYLPDSYNEWLPADSAPAEVESDKKKHRGAWQVYIRWLTDSYKYNEWMNAIDYETEEAQEAATASKKRAAGEEVAGAAAGGAGVATVDVEVEVEEEDGPAQKKARGMAVAVMQRRPGGPQPEVHPDEAEIISTGVVKRYVIRPHLRSIEHATSGVVIDISHGQRTIGTGVPAASFPAPAAAAAAASHCGGGKPLQGAVCAMPAGASWFDVTKVHTIELAAFADVDVTVYRKIRDAIVEMHKEEPGKMLTFIDAKKTVITTVSTGGDLNVVRRIFEFLDYNNIINYPAKKGLPGSAKVTEPRPGASAAAEAAKYRGAAGGVVAGGSSHCHSYNHHPDDVRHIPPGVEAALKKKTTATIEEGLEAAATGPLVGGYRVDIKPKTFSILKGGNLPASVSGIRYYCTAMPWVECTNLRYHCTKFPDVDLCPAAFAEGRFPPGCCASDFVRVGWHTVVPEDTDWSDQETLRLLEALETYMKQGEKWDMVARHVGTRNQMQCAMHFLQSPIEDTFLSDLGMESRVIQQQQHQALAAKALNLAISNADGAHDDGGNGTEKGDTATLPPPGTTVDRLLKGHKDQVIVPFADTGNPLMTQVAFLTAMIGPKVAAAAAKAGLEALLTGNDGRVGDGDNGNISGNATNDDVSAAAVKSACAVSLSAAAVKARTLADAEEREMHRLITALLDTANKKMAVKLRYLDKMEEHLVNERAQLHAYKETIIKEYQEKKRGRKEGGGGGGGGGKEEGGEEGGARPMMP